ncbi:MAG: subunit of meta cleavage enzyme [Pseudomonadota bacterium]
MKNWAQTIPSPDAYWVNRVLFDTQHQPELMARFRADSQGYLADMPLLPTSRTALIDNAIGALYHAGANPYLLRAHCLTLGVPEDEYLHALRTFGQSQHG